jgi:hypothetical protein
MATTGSSFLILAVSMPRKIWKSQSIVPQSLACRARSGSGGSRLEWPGITW